MVLVPYYVIIMSLVGKVGTQGWLAMNVGAYRWLATKVGAYGEDMLASW